MQRKENLKEYFYLEVRAQKMEGTVREVKKSRGLLLSQGDTKG